MNPLILIPGVPRGILLPWLQMCATTKTEGIVVPLHGLFNTSSPMTTNKTTSDRLTRWMRGVSE